MRAARALLQHLTLLIPPPPPRQHAIILQDGALAVRVALPDGFQVVPIDLDRPALETARAIHARMAPLC